MVNALKIILFLLLCSVSISCGVYGFRGNNPPPGINSVFVPTFQDVSGFSAPTLADDFTLQLKAKIISDNTFRLADKTLADATLKCTVSNVRDEAIVISSGETVSRRKVTISVNVEFDNLKTQKTIWNRVFENYGEYNSSNTSFSDRSKGISTAVERITDDILIEITSTW